MTTRLFITGATGYIGGAVFTRLLEKKSTLNLEIVALFREKAKADKVEGLGAQYVIGSLDDLDLLRNEAEKSDIVLHTADADHKEAASALAEGLKLRAQKKLGSKRPIFIHTSGTGVLMDHVFGASSSDKYFDDSVYADTHENIAPDALHREIDNIVYDAGRSGIIDTVIVCPPLIYGTSNGKFKRDSQQVPGLIAASIKHGRSIYVGKGLNMWSNVHVEDLAEFYILLVTLYIEGKDFPKNDNGYYFVENGTHQFKVLAGHIGKALVKVGAIKDPEPEGIEGGDVISPRLRRSTGHNSLSIASKARKLGWKPVRERLFDTLEDTCDRIYNKKE